MASQAVRNLMSREREAPGYEGEQDPRTGKPRRGEQSQWFIDNVLNKKAAGSQSAGREKHDA